MQILLKATKKSWKAKKKNSQNRSKAWRKRVASGDHKELAKGQQGKCGGELRVNCSAVSHGMARENCCRVKWRQGGQRKRRKVCNVFKANFRPTKPYLSHVTAQAKVTVTVTVRVTVTVTVTLHVTLQLSFDFSVTAPHPTPFSVFLAVHCHWKFSSPFWFLKSHASTGQLDLVSLCAIQHLAAASPLSFWLLAAIRIEPPLPQRRHVHAVKTGKRISHLLQFRARNLRWLSQFD